MKILTINYFREVICTKWFWLLISITLLGIFLFSNFSNWAYDDPFITYRYAENLKNGLGFVYNPGEKILSTTTPLFTLILAIMGFSGVDVPQLANLLGVFALLFGGVFLWDLGYTFNTPVIGWAGLLLYPTFPLVVTTIGSETPLYLAFCIGSFLFYVRDRYIIAGILASLAVLTRPDAVLVVLILGLDYLLRNKRLPSWKVIFVFIIPIFLWIVFAWIYFGDPIPVTLVAKQLQGSMEVSQKFAQGIITIAQFYIVRWYYWIELLLLLIGLLYIVIHKYRWLLFLLWPGVYFLSFTLIGVSRYFWYYAPLVPGFIVLIGGGIMAICSWIQSIYEKQSSDGPMQKNNRPIGSESINPRLAGFLILFLIVYQVQDLLSLRRIPDRRLAIYRVVGDWLNNYTSPGDQVGAMEVGIIGYYSKRPMIDFAGIIQPEIAKHFLDASSYEEAALWALDYYAPHYLVLPANSYPEIQREFIVNNCQLISIFSREGYSSYTNIEVFKCSSS
jgi:hypothetical protein